MLGSAGQRVIEWVVVRAVAFGQTGASRSGNASVAGLFAGAACCFGEFYNLPKALTCLRLMGGYLDRLCLLADHSFVFV